MGGRVDGRGGVDCCLSIPLYCLFYDTLRRSLYDTGLVWFEIIRGGFSVTHYTVKKDIAMHGYLYLV